MARSSTRFGLPRLAVVVDSTDPAAPTNLDGSPKTTPVVGVASVANAAGIVVDVVPANGSGTAHVAILYWNEIARRWVQDPVIPAASVAGRPTRYTWEEAVGARYVYALVLAVTDTVDIYTGGNYTEGA